MAGFRKFYQKLVAPLYSGASTTSNIVRVNTVAKLQAAVVAQKANQIIQIEPGSYTLTADLDIPLAATGGVLEGLGQVSITGAAGEDSAILVNPAVGTATFEYTLKNIDGVQGGADKVGLLVKNTAIKKKIIIYLKGTTLYSNGSGNALTVTGTDASNAIRIYAQGNGAGWDAVSITTANAGDKYFFYGINFEDTFAGSVTDLATQYKFINCELIHAGMTGGHATNVVNCVNCWTIETTAVAVVDSGEFPNAFSATII